jgi:terminase large subunit-like protein
VAPTMPRSREQIVFVEGLVDGSLKLLEEMCGIALYTYQQEIAYRIFFSLLIGDSEEITIECARQSGKSETLACVAATTMVIFPKLAAMYPKDMVLQKFKHGVMIGCFGPTQDQSETIFSRIETRLTSETAKAVLNDDEIMDEMKQSGDLLKLKSGSFCRMQTAHPKARIESKTYHLIIIDEAQDADSESVRRRIHPMTTAVAGTIVKVGTPAAHKSDYYEAILRNKNRTTYGQSNHFSYTWKRAAKENPFYAQSIRKEMKRLGPDSDEFLMSYSNVWMLQRGMFITDEQINALGDRSMKIQRSWFKTPIVMGIDIAKKHDSTVCTAVFVDWDNPDEFGLYYHRVLSWFEMRGENWEDQYPQICEYASRYSVMRIGVDAQGMGDPVAEHLQKLMPRTEVVPLAMNPMDQTVRWQHLLQLIGRGYIGWPAHPEVRRLHTYQRFIQQMSEVEREYRGKYLLVGTPKNEKNSHDDYVDSLALACSLTIDMGGVPEVEQWSTNPFFQRGTG